MISLPPFKTCKRCGLCQPFDTHHYAPHKRSNGKVTWDCRHCKCESAQASWQRVVADPKRMARARDKSRQWARKERRLHPERIRRRHDKWYAKVKAKPGSYVDLMVTKRIDRRARMAEQTGSDPVRPSRPTHGPYQGPSNAETVPAEPLVAFLRDLFDDWGADKVYAELDGAVSTRGIYRLLTEHQPVVALEFADRLLTRGLGRPDLLNALYPVEES